MSSSNCPVLLAQMKEAKKKTASKKLTTIIMYIIPIVQSNSRNQTLKMIHISIKNDFYQFFI